MTLRALSAPPVLVALLSSQLGYAKDGPSTTLTADNEDAARSRCVTHFYGKSLAPGIGGDGVVMGAYVWRKKGANFFAVAPTFALSIGFSMRLSELEDRCDAFKLAHLVNTYQVSVDRSPVWVWSFSTAVAPATLGVVNVSEFSSIQGSFGALLTLGFKPQRVWWDDSASSRNVLAVPFGIVGGLGTISQTDGGEVENVGSGFLGLYAGVRLEL